MRRVPFFEGNEVSSCVPPVDGVRVAKVRKGEGYTLGHSQSTASSGLEFNKEEEAETLKECMDTWQKSSRCCPSSCGDLCGMVILNRKDSGHCRNVLFEKCSEHGGNGHENLVEEYTGGKPLTCSLIYGYSVQGGHLRLNSGTFNGDTMPEKMKNA